MRCECEKKIRQIDKGLCPDCREYIAFCLGDTTESAPTMDLSHYPHTERSF